MTAKKQGGVTSELVLVTPELAAEWLGTNVHNRNIRQRHIAELARDMSNGDWHFTGEPIKFDCNGNLIDGQHRLMAVIRSGRAIEFLVLRGLQPIAQDFMDSGTKRTAADMLNLRGHANANTVASVARFAILLDEGDSVSTGGGNRSVTKSEISAWIDANPDVAEAATATTRLMSFLPFSPTALAYSWLILSRIDRIETAAFFDSLANNATNGKGDPRNTLLRRMSSAKRADERLRAQDQVGFIVRAWNAHRKGVRLTVLKARYDSGSGSARTSIPKAV